MVRDLVEIETAAFWRDAPEIESGEVAPADIATEVFFLPAATHVEKKGTFTNTQRLLQWREQAVEPPGDCRSELWFMYHLGRRVREKLAGSDDAERDRAVLDLTWDYPTEGAERRPDAEAVLREIGGVDLTTGKEARRLPAARRTTARPRAAAGSTRACYADGVNQVGAAQAGLASRRGWRPSGAGRGRMNRRILYNRASADPDGQAVVGAQALRLVGRRRRASGPARTCPTSRPTRRPTTSRRRTPRAQTALRGDEPFIMQADGKAWLYAPSGAGRRAAAHALRAARVAVRQPALRAQQSNPARQQIRRPENPYNPTHGEPGDERLPLRGHDLPADRAPHGGRDVALAALPGRAAARDVLRGLARRWPRERGLEHGGWATIVTLRAAIEARVLVTERMTPLTRRARRLHQVGLPYHWGSRGLARGDSANDLLALALDPNVHIGEYKALTCDIRPGRRPRGAGAARAPRRLPPPGRARPASPSRRRGEQRP